MQAPVGFWDPAGKAACRLYLRVNVDWLRELRAPQASPPMAIPVCHGFVDMLVASVFDQHSVASPQQP